MNSFASSPSVGLRLPPMKIFNFSIKPGTITPDLQSPPMNDAPLSLIHPLTINPELFRISLQLKYVLTFVATYLTGVFIMNQINAARHHRPWAFSRTSSFKAAVFIHNVLLAVFSAWTLLSGIFFLRTQWDLNLDESSSYAHVAELLCQRDSSSYQLLESSASPLEAGGFYYVWIFYMSKFYEVLDTMIILSKGKKCSLLQSYHHSGIILLGWAAVSYQSLSSMLGGVNAIVHTFMYTYFAIQTLGLTIPPFFKRLLTSIQITQFIFGLIFSNLALFVGYRVPLDSAMTATSGSMEGRSSPSDHGNHSVKGEGLYRPELAMNELTPCMSKSGEGIPIMVGTIYLLPLTYLFVRFFIRSYIHVSVKVKRN